MDIGQHVFIDPGIFIVYYQMPVLVGHIKQGGQHIH